MDKNSRGHIFEAITSSKVKVLLTVTESTMRLVKAGIRILAPWQNVICSTSVARSRETILRFQSLQCPQIKEC